MLLSKGSSAHVYGTQFYFVWDINNKAFNPSTLFVQASFPDITMIEIVIKIIMKMLVLIILMLLLMKIMIPGSYVC